MTLRSKNKFYFWSWLSNRGKDLTWLQKYNILPMFDIFGREVSLKALKRTSFKTILGSLLSIVFYIFMVFNVIYLLMEIQDTTTPDIYVSTDSSDSRIPTNIGKTKQIPGFAIFSIAQEGYYVHQFDQISKYLTIEMETKEVEQENG